MNKLISILLLVSMPLIASTVSAQERIELEDGTRLSVFIVPPAEPVAEPSPLLILMGGGSGNASISRDVSRWLGSGFAQRGWLVAVPVSPNNSSFRGFTNNEMIPQLISELQKRENVSSRKALLAGISNGGLSALEIARRNPDNYLGVVAVPALASSAYENRSLAGFPVYLRIGSEDQLDWANRFDDTVAAFTEAGVDLDAAILEGAAHMFQMDWESLDPWLDDKTN